MLGTRFSRSTIARSLFRSAPRRAAALLVGLLGPLVAGGPAFATCVPVAGTTPGIIPAAFEPVTAPAVGEVRLTYLGHSSFLIETPGGATVVTDYNGYVRADVTPDAVTMNNAHSTHYTDVVEPGVQHVLRGWDPGGGVAVHEVELKDLKIRNVPTNVRDFGGTRYNGNSIFVFEVADLCIAHLGHLHHVLSDEHLGKLGVIDVLLAPIDGAYTMSHERLAVVIEQINPAVVIPMHYVGTRQLGGIMELVGDRYEVLENGSPTVTISRLTLPYHKVLVLPTN